MKNLIIALVIALLPAIPNPLVAGPAAQASTARAYICPDCGQDCDKLTFDKPGKCPNCGMTLIEKATQQKVAVLLFDGAEIIDYAGPWEVFGESGYKVYTVAEKAEPIKAVFGQKVVPDYTFANCPKADILLVPGGGVDDAVANPQLIKWLQTNAKDAKYVMSVCTGAFILSKAGLLDGLSATTISHAIDDLQKASPKTKVVHDQRYVDNGKVITTAGLSSGIDGAFHLVGRINGEGEAQGIALGMEYRWDPQASFARAALADRYLPDFSDAKGVTAKLISTAGDQGHWELKALVSAPNSAAAINDLLRQRIASSTPHINGAVKLADDPANQSSLSWKFTDDEGHVWAGEETVQPAPDQKDQFVVTLKLSRQLVGANT
jgi:putative intracellular protease/amidase